jgi:hypothetical protein
MNTTTDCMNTTTDCMNTTTDCMNTTKDFKIHYIQQKLSIDKTNKFYTIVNNIIQNYNLDYSSNKNGIFLNISLLDEFIIDIIYKNFVNSEGIVSPKEQPTKEIKSNITLIKKKEYKLIKDKLNLDKFDKFLLQLSRTNISL